MCNVAIMASLRNLPLVAEFGFSSLFFFLIVGITFLVPCALISAELATGWPKSGGIYIWVREAFGDRWGFFAIWMQWIHNVTWYPAILSFLAVTLGYVFSPTLATNRYYILTIILTTFWGMTILNYFGIRTSSLVSTVGVIIGTIIPGALIIALGITWILQGRPLEVTFSAKAFLPDFKSFSTIVFMAGLFLSFAGLEVSSAYAGEVKDPQKNYPLSILYAALITFVLVTLGALAIAIVIPTTQISLVSGVMEAFRLLISHFHSEWLVPLVALMLAVGVIAEVNSWIIGPVKALYTTSIHGNLPPFFQNQNKHGMPTHLLLLQGLIVTASAFVFLTMPTLSSSYWILSALSAQMYLVMYVLMFLTGIRLRYTKPHVPRAYKIPNPHQGMWIVACVGTASSLFALILSFVPPSQLQITNLFFYEGFLIFGLGCMIALPLIIYQFKKPSWNLQEVE